MKHYDFCNDCLRTGCTPATLKYQKEPVSHKQLVIDIRVGKASLANLVKLIPKVVILKLRFNYNEIVYDIEPLAKLTRLRDLVIKGETEPRLIGLNKLSSLNLESLILYKQKLDPQNPIFDWPKI